MQAAVLGSPIKHSLSPRLHKAAYQYLGIAGEYTSINVDSDQLIDFFAVNESSFDYFSLTMPLKEIACTLPVIYDDLPILINSANTLIKRDTRWSLHSTDGSGFLAAIEHAGLSSIGSTLILGSGGTARAIAQSLDNRSERIDVIARAANRRASIESTIKFAEFDFISWNDSVDFNDYDLIVNTTPAGAADLMAEKVPAKTSGMLFDVLYKPWPTVLARKWSDCGGTVINGLELLIYQGVDQISLVLDRELDKEALAIHLRKTLKV